jgi:DNA-binding IclR family transcriptional regulator
MATTMTKDTASNRRQVPAVSRAIAILDYLASAKEPVGVVPLARHIGLIPSTCLHILRALADEGLVMSNPQTKQYSIGAGVLSLARAYARQDPLIQVTQAQLEDLSKRHGCAFAAVERSGTDHCIVVAIGDAQAGLSVRVSIGTRFPALVSATGICFAAFGAMEPDEIRRGFERLAWDDPIAFDAWLEEVEKARRLGYAVDEGHFIVGTRIVAVPVFRHDRTLLGCIAAVGLRERLAGNALSLLIEDLRTVAGEVDAALAARGDGKDGRRRRKVKAKA